MAREYSPEVKAAVMAALIAGQTVRQIEREYGVSKGTISAWNQEAKGIVSAIELVPNTKKEQIKGLLIDLLIAKIKAQIAISEHAANAEWLANQDASALAMFYGVSDDKLIRLLEKFEGVGHNA